MNPDSKNDAVWYRVRVGNYSYKENAIKAQQQIESIFNKNTWLDVITK